MFKHFGKRAIFSISTCGVVVVLFVAGFVGHGHHGTGCPNGNATDGSHDCRPPTHTPKPKPTDEPVSATPVLQWTVPIPTPELPNTGTGPETKRGGAHGGGVLAPTPTGEAIPLAERPS